MFFANMDNQDKLLTAIRRRLPKGASVIEEIAAVLAVSYDAAHRRASQKSKFSIEETVQLCRHFSISMDSLFTDTRNVIVEKTAEIRTMDDMAAYFKESAERIAYFGSIPQSQMIYSAKDIPLFHTIGGTLLSKFKLYVWNLLVGSQAQESFENFSIIQNLLEHSSRLKSVYDNVEVSEIWNDTTINSALQQIYYFFQAGLLSVTNARHLCHDLHEILHQAENRCCMAGSNYNLYYNELLILNNNVLLTSPEKQSLFVPYTMLGYFITSDNETCSNAREFFRHQIKNSKSLNESGPRDRKIFFNRAHQKIELYEQRVQNETNIDL